MTMNGTLSEIPEGRTQSVASTLVRVVLVLAVAQLVRGYVTWFLYDAIKPGLLDPRWYLVSGAGFLAAGFVLWLILRPSLADLGLGGAELHRVIQSRIIALAVIITVTFAATFITLTSTRPDLLPKYLYWAIFIPLFEELLFRGYLWGRIQPLFSGRWAPWLTYGFVTLLFGFWHLGYLDVLTLRVLPYGSVETTLADLLLRTVLVGWLVGLQAGFGRLRMGGIYGAFLLHAFWNLLTA